MAFSSAARCQPGPSTTALQKPPSTPKQPSGVASRVLTSGAASTSSAPATKPSEARQPRPRAWRLRDDRPSDVWLTYGFGRESAGATEQFHQWDGHRWHTIETAPFKVSGLEPHRIFDWFDGTKLVAQAGHWFESVSYRVRVEPFRVWGKTSHRPPDFWEIHAETVLDTPGFADGHVALGRWGERDVAMAWGETLLSLDGSSMPAFTNRPR